MRISIKPGNQTWLRLESLRVKVNLDHMKRKMIRQDLGISIIELMVVIAIVAIVGSIAVPSYIAWLPKYRLSTASRDVLSDLEYARGYAIKMNASVVLQFDTGQNIYEAWVDNGALGNKDNWNRDADENLIRSRQMAPGVDLAAVSFLNHRVRFNGNGFPETEPDPPAALGGGTITLTNRSGTQVVELKIGGKARIQ
jgi:type IV fimbrial biogenesis protein FimT